MQQKTHRGPEARGRGETPDAGSQGAETVQAPTNRESPSSTAWLMEAICEPVNLRQALKRVKANKGAAGADGMSVSELPEHLRHNWPELKAQLLSGSYQPSPVRRVTIPKPGGGERLLGIPTVVDRFIQQAMMQVLQARWDASFSDSSYGFRPGRSAHQAVKQAHEYIRAGYHWVVNLDLEKFFDRVNHDVLMNRIAKRVSDKRVLSLIRRFLNAGVMEAGLVRPVTEGTPQGGPLSPLLSNLLLDDFDKELEKRGLKFARYADDCNVYVKSERAGNRVMAGLTHWLSRKLKLKVNADKSAVAHPETRKLLGYSFRRGQQVWCVVSPESVKRFKTRIKELTRRTTGRSLEQLIQPLKRYLTGWKSYYRLNQWSSLMRGLSRWIRRRLRSILWKQWKTGSKRYKELRSRGISKALAAQTVGSCHKQWRISYSPALNIALPNRLFTGLGLPELQAGDD
ncbi:group II intron reverse transcriptase/maturase (plasmid) [Klebsiella quasipneumoniae]|uniref:group II intron reverse transcriptase/maturase n=2 Tax=Klebsiella quasipneumoniae TaxID=1463165 RepID=UPI0010F5A423|nr:group II intron reverse transcriptase/maturase [Klebsiella quasipneumoniae]MCA5547017.1 group II intron reverse transcriptase/maturase [Klebsiella pneumoniae]MBC5069980.1 group II intron reverse transcriptase/maturase [Klebsiella quasipneumoniae]MBC5150595.1 group II intron reverse transcriptase/maturase [Klebsiella quasipneumoniae]MCB3394029.1 group II intron reverse transcriptase/maturase [Klebsiella quasipneumoniae]MCB3412011.1 group II intron reverse transcriptase/maturase [Klebsiella q